MSSSSNPKPSRKLPVAVWVLAFSLIAVSFGACTNLSGCQPKNMNDMTRANPVSRDVVTVFFSKNQGDHSIVENVVRPIPAESKDKPLEFALQELLKGPTSEEKSQGFYSEIPKGTSLVGLKQDSNAVTINLSRQFTVGGGSTSMVQRFEQIKQTVYSVDNSHQINLAVEGKPLETLGGEGLEVQEGLKREQQ